MPFALISGFLLALVAAAPAARAGSVTYNVDLTFGSGYMIGAITTDGSAGPLTDADILDWSLAISDGNNSRTLTGPLSGDDSTVSISGDDLTATGSALSFDFSGTDSGVFAFHALSPPPTFIYLQDNSSISRCGSSLVGDVCISVDSDDNTVTTVTGDVVIGTPASSAPEPSTLALLGSGIALLGFRRATLVFSK